MRSQPYRDVVWKKRSANSAFYIIVLARLRWDIRTRAYIDRRITEGRTKREAIRRKKEAPRREESDGAFLAFLAGVREISAR
ncbi:hypothetical protein [Actinoplanes sp. NPDC051411]|uniref:hypothetical protein n=1 Tax=Actinoplanes sp. NPDC051411 TaxID=3155522 RepID=UPI003414D7D8